MVGCIVHLVINLCFHLRATKNLHPYAIVSSSTREQIPGNPKDSKSQCNIYSESIEYCMSHIPHTIVESSFLSVAASSAGLATPMLLGSGAEGPGCGRFAVAACNL